MGETSEVERMRAAVIAAAYDAMECGILGQEFRAALDALLARLRAAEARAERAEALLAQMETVEQGVERAHRARQRLKNSGAKRIRLSDVVAEMEREADAFAHAERYRVALEYYANPDNWRKDDWGIKAIGAEYGESGNIARRALGQEGA